jgi:hypothetical protein
LIGVSPDCAIQIAGPFRIGYFVGDRNLPDVDDRFVA